MLCLSKEATLVLAKDPWRQRSFCFSLFLALFIFGDRLYISGYPEAHHVDQARLTELFFISAS